MFSKVFVQLWKILSFEAVGAELDFKILCVLKLDHPICQVCSSWWMLLLWQRK